MWTDPSRVIESSTFEREVLHACMGLPRANRTCACADRTYKQVLHAWTRPLRVNKTSTLWTGFPRMKGSIHAWTGPLRVNGVFTRYGSYACERDLHGAYTCERVFYVWTGALRMNGTATYERNLHLWMGTPRVKPHMWTGPSHVSLTSVCEQVLQV